jgi:hypothetical protein
MKYRTKPHAMVAILFSAVLSLTVAACGPAGSQVASNAPDGGRSGRAAANSPNHPWSAGSIYAFQDYHSGYYYVANGAKVLFHLKGWMPPVFSANGRYVISSDNAALYLYSLQTGTEYTRPFTYNPNCLPEFTLGSINDKYVYVADPDLIRYTLPGFAHGVPVPSRLPRGPICPIGDIGNNALVLVGADTGWELYEVSPGGASRHLGQDPLWTVSEATSNNLFVGTSRAANGDPAVAYDYWNGQGFLVRVLDLRSNSTFDVDAAKLGVPLTGQGFASGAYVEDLWWSRDGHLYAIMSSYSKNAVESPQQTWRLDGHTWVEWDSRFLVGDRSLDNGMSIVLVPPTPIQPDDEWIGAYNGKLYLQAPSEHRLVWKGAAEDIIIPSGEAGNTPSRI